MKMNEETHNCSICHTEINTAESKMIVDRDEDHCLRGTLCVACHAVVSRDDPFVLLQAIEYILLGGYPEEFEDDGETVPKPKRVRRGLTEQDRDLLVELRGKREFITLRDDEFTIPKLKGRKKASPKKKPATGKNRQVKKPAEKKTPIPRPKEHRQIHQPKLVVPSAA